MAVLLFAGTALLLVPAAWAAPGDHDAVVSGVVRDSQGVAQMGALVQVLTGGSRTVATAFTDLHGRYFFANLVPGRYQVRASATLFVSATRSNLQLNGGARAVVNLTLAALFDTASWLPASRRRADEPADDWQWTLRSTANRPILRITEDDGVVVLSSLPESPRGRMEARETALGNGGGFGRSGVEEVLTLHRSLASGTESTLRASLGTAALGQRIDPGSRTSFEVETGFERQTGYGGGSRTVVGYSSHPELAGPGGAAGLEVLELRSGEQVALGENVELEVGAEALGVHGGGAEPGGAYALAAHPFLRLTAHPGGPAQTGRGSWRVQYRMASSRDTQEFADLKAEREEVPVAVREAASVALEAGRHQEISIARSTGRGVVEIAYYHDAVTRTPLSGVGTPGLPLKASQAGVQPSGFLVDPVSGTFRALGGAYSSHGERVTWTAPLAPGVWIAAEYATGAALRMDSNASPSPGVSGAVASLKPSGGESAAVSLKGDLKHFGTRIRAAYRWQPEEFVSAVDPYGALADQAFLSCMVRQRLHLGSWLPPGFDATIDVTNLLAQGYRPFLSADGRTLYLAQAPREIQAGLSFTF